MMKSLRDAVMNKLNSIEDSINRLRLDTSMLNTKVDGLYDKVGKNGLEIESNRIQLSNMQEQLSKLQDTLDSNTLDTSKLYKDTDSVVLKDNAYKDTDNTKPTIKEPTYNNLTGKQQCIADHSYLYYIVSTEQGLTVASTKDTNTQDFRHGYDSQLKIAELTDKVKVSNLCGSSIYIY